MKRKGLVALLDGMQAYTIAFVAVGILTLLMMGTQPSDTLELYNLNVMAEDLADSIGINMIPSGGIYSDNVNWRNDINSSILSELGQSIGNLSQTYFVAINVTIEESGSPTVLISAGDISQAGTVATAVRLLYPVAADPSLIDYTADASLLIVKVGR